MEQFKQELSEDGLSFTSQTKVYFGQSGKNKLLQLSEVMRYCSDIATDLYRARGQCRDFLVAHNYALMVSRSSFHINKLPKEDDVIFITVREEKPEGFQLVRTYEFKTPENEVLIAGKSTWVAVHPETRQIIAPANFEFLAKSDVVTPFEKKPGKIKVPENVQLLGEQKILYSHIDGNGHLTNSKYINFALDFLPEEYQTKNFTDFRINFCKEIFKGEVMKVYGAFDDENKKITIVGKKETESSFECELFW